MELMVSRLQDFKESLLEQGYISRDLILSLEHELDRKFITENININMFTIAPSSLGLEETIKIIDNKLLELSNVSLEDSSSIAESLIREDITSLYEVFYRDSKRLENWFTNSELRATLNLLASSNFFDSVDKNLHSCLVDGRFVKIKDLESNIVLKNLDLLNELCGDRVSEEFDTIYNTLSNLVEDVYVKGTKDECILFTSYHRLTRYMNAYDITEERPLFKFDLAKFYHNEIANNTNIGFIVYIIKLMSRFDYEIFKSFIYNKMYLENDKEKIIDILDVVGAIANVFEYLAYITGSNIKKSIV